MSEQAHTHTDGKLEPGSLTKNSPVLRWLDNFWYHHKWTVIIVAFFVSVLVICTVQFLERPSYDTSIVHASAYYMSKEEAAAFEKLIENVCPADFNKDGKKDVNLINYVIYSDKEYEEESEYYASVTNENGETDAFHINGEFNADQMDSFRNYTMTGETTVYLLNDAMYESLRDSVDSSNHSRLTPLSEIYTDGQLPAGALPDGYGIRLGDTAFYQFFYSSYYERAEGERGLSPDLILCVHAPSNIIGRTKNKQNYANDIAFFRAIAEFQMVTE